jgi:pyruvate dehydrogenase E2 component (dihydrolipoamide acetyltransferase)
MATTVVMEALSPTMEEGRLVEWKKQPGDVVAVGDVLAEVETDKAVMELVARAAGSLLQHAVAAGTTVPVGNAVAYIGQPGEAVNGGAPPAPPVAAAAPSAPATPKDPQGTQPVATEPRPTSMPPAPPAAAATEGHGEVVMPATGVEPAPTATHDGGRVKASPLARKLAAERGLDLGAVTGTGPEGRIVLRDVEGAKAGVRTPARPAPAAPAAAAARPAAAAPPRPALVPAGESFADVPLSQMRKTIAKRLAQSIGPVPTFYLTAEADMERAAEARESLNALGEGKVSFNDIILKATAAALHQHPACNAWWQDDRIRYWNDVHLSMAVAIEDGLITPVIRHADRKTLREIGAEARDLAERARTRKLVPEEYTGGTFSVSNLGMFDIDEFTAIINPPEAGILAVGRIAEKVVAHEGRPAVRRQLRLTMSCDHRVIDGATGAAFLRTLVRMLENPLALVW